MKQPLVLSAALAVFVSGCGAAGGRLAGRDNLARS
jgi:hypothetical protein